MEDIRNNIFNVITTCDTAQFCTFSTNQIYPETRTVANAINKNKSNTLDLTLYFMTNINSNKIDQIRDNNNVCIYYFNPKTRKSINLFGYTEIIDSPEEKSKFWNDTWKDFGYNGKDDKEYCIIKFVPKHYKFFIGRDEKNGSI